jgi:sugar lactone lactonase YvrE
MKKIIPIKVLNSFVLIFCTNLINSQVTEVVSGLSKPYGLALENNGKLYIAESGTTNGNKISYVELYNPIPLVKYDLFTTNLNSPTRLKLNDDYLYATESSSNFGEISRAYIGGTTQTQMQSYYSLGLVTPIGMDINNGNLYIGDYGNYAIKKVNTSVSPFQTSLLTNNLATDIIVDGTLFYYTNPNYGNVLVYDLINPSPTPIDIVTGIAHPSSLLLHNNILYISDSSEGKIYRINPYGSSTIPELIVSGLNEPQSMVIYNDELYVAESNANRIVKINLTTLGNVDFENSFSIIISPNPVQNIINIQSEETIKKFSIYDVLGKKINVNHFSNKSFDISNLARGMYLINIELENGKIFKSKIMKE